MGGVSLRAIALVVVLVVVLVLLGCGAEPTATAERERPTHLILAGDGELWVVDVDAERAHRRRIERLTPGDPLHRVVRRGDRFVLFGFATYAMDGPDAPLTTIADDSWFFVPSAHPDRVWLAFLQPRQRPQTVRLGAIREVAMDGRVTSPAVRPPDGSWPLAAVSSGIVYGDGEEHVVWDPATRSEVRRVPGRFVGPGHDDLLVTADPDECGDLVITDVATGAARRVAPIVRGGCWGIHEAEFSPDGSRLAVTFTRESGMGLEAPHELALIDPATGEATVVAGSEVPAGYVFVAWSAAGEEVFVTGGERFRGRTLLAYRLGDPAPRRLDVEVGDFYDMAAR